MVAVSAPCKRAANALQTPKDSVEAPWDRGDRRGSSVWSPWGRNGINDIRYRHSANAVNAPWGCGRDAVTSPYTPGGRRANEIACSSVLAAIMCAPTARARRRHGALGDLTALLLRCRCEPTEFPRRSFGSPWERRATARTLCMHKIRAVAWRPRRAHGVQWRCHGDATAIPRRSRRSHCAHLGVLSFSCTPCSRREDTDLVWQGLYMMMSWFGYIFLNTGPLCVETSGYPTQKPVIQSFGGLFLVSPGSWTNHRAAGEMKWMLQRILVTH